MCRYNGVLHLRVDRQNGPHSLFPGWTGGDRVIILSPTDIFHNATEIENATGYHNVYLKNKTTVVYVHDDLSSIPESHIKKLKDNLRWQDGWDNGFQGKWIEDYDHTKCREEPSAKRRAFIMEEIQKHMDQKADNNE